jgi:hypothetical protein
MRQTGRVGRGEDVASGYIRLYAMKNSEINLYIYP